MKHSVSMFIGFSAGLFTWLFLYDY